MMQASVGIPVYVIFRILLCLAKPGFYRGGWDDYRLWPKTEMDNGSGGKLAEVACPKLLKAEMGNK